MLQWHSGGAQTIADKILACIVSIDYDRVNLMDEVDFGDKITKGTLWLRRKNGIAN